MPIRKLLLLFTLAFSASSQAATMLQFTTPDANVGTNDVIEIWVTLTTDTGFTLDTNDPMGDMSLGGAIDPNDFPFGGFAPDANMGQGGFVAFDFVDFAAPTVSITCAGSFVQNNNGDCALSNENYTFNFTSGGDWAPNGMLSLAAGESLDILIGAFIPVAGGATPGVYDLSDAGIGISFAGVGFDDFGEEVFINTFVEISDVCDIGDTSCDFTRVVGAQVPVPAAMWLMMSALLGLFSVRSRRKTI